MNPSESVIHWEEKFHACLAHDFLEPEYFQVHHLLVLTYMIQADEYSSDYFPVALDILRRFLNTALRPESLPRMPPPKIEGKSIYNRSKKDPCRYPWRKTIMDIRIENAYQYVADVRSWAEDVVKVIGECQMKLD